MITSQQRWNRYVDAINYCIDLGYYIDCIYKTPDYSGNVHSIEVYNEYTKREATIRLKPKKYKSYELLEIIVNRVGKTPLFSMQTIKQYQLNNNNYGMDSSR